MRDIGCLSLCSTPQHIKDKTNNVRGQAGDISLLLAALANRLLQPFSFLKLMSVKSSLCCEVQHLVLQAPHRTPTVPDVELHNQWDPTHTRTDCYNRAVSVETAQAARFTRSVAVLLLAGYEVRHAEQGVPHRIA